MSFQDLTAARAKRAEQGRVGARNSKRGRGRKRKDRASNASQWHECRGRAYGGNGRGTRQSGPGGWETFGGANDGALSRESAYSTHVVVTAETRLRPSRVSISVTTNRRVPFLRSCRPNQLS